MALRHSVPRSSVFVGGNRNLALRESMTLSDQGTYGTVLAVTGLTDGTRDSIRMANPGSTVEAGVMTGAQVLSLGWFKFRSTGVCGKYSSPRGECERCKAVALPSAC